MVTPSRVASRGPCSHEGPHLPHTYQMGRGRDGGLLLHECYGQASHCSNCDDQGCMDCRLRVHHAHCEWSCPCCQEGDASYLQEEGYRRPQLVPVQEQDGSLTFREEAPHGA